MEPSFYFVGNVTYGLGARPVIFTETYYDKHDINTNIHGSLWAHTLFILSAFHSTLI